MKKRTFSLLWLLGLTLLGLGVGEVCAQLPQTLEIGVKGGAAYYVGDLNPSKQFCNSTLQYGGIVRYNYDPRWVFRVDYTHGTVEGSDAIYNVRPERDLSFHTKFDELNFIVEFNFLEYYTGIKKRSFSPYFFGGASVFMFDPYSLEDMTPLRPLHTEGQVAEVDDDIEGQQKIYGRVSCGIPFGFGFKFGLGARIGVALEWQMLMTFTDYLDDVSGLYPEVHAINEETGYDYTDPTGHYLPGMQRGDSSSNDWLGFANLSITYKINLPKREMCNLKRR